MCADVPLNSFPTPFKMFVDIVVAALILWLTTTKEQNVRRLEAQRNELNKNRTQRQRSDAPFDLHFF